MLRHCQLKPNPFLPGFSATLLSLYIRNWILTTSKVLVSAYLWPSPLSWAKSGGLNTAWSEPKLHSDQLHWPLSTNVIRSKSPIFLWNGSSFQLGIAVFINTENATITER